MQFGVEEGLADITSQHIQIDPSTINKETNIETFMIKPVHPLNSVSKGDKGRSLDKKESTDQITSRAFNKESSIQLRGQEALQLESNEDLKEAMISEGTQKEEEQAEVI